MQCKNVSSRMYKELCTCVRVKFSASSALAFCRNICSAKMNLVTSCTRDCACVCVCVLCAFVCVCVVLSLICLCLVSGTSAAQNALFMSYTSSVHVCVVIHKQCACVCCHTQAVCMRVSVMVCVGERVCVCMHVYRYTDKLFLHTSMKSESIHAYINTYIHTFKHTYMAQK
jgi:hypothetical protein